MKTGAMAIIHFEDGGQDFLSWEVESMGGGMYVVTDSPGQMHPWLGMFILSGVAVGQRPVVSKSPDDEVLTLNYAITKIEGLPHVQKAES